MRPYLESSLYSRCSLKKYEFIRCPARCRIGVHLFIDLGRHRIGVPRAVLRMEGRSTGTIGTIRCGREGAPTSSRSLACASLWCRRDGLR